MKISKDVIEEIVNNDCEIKKICISQSAVINATTKYFEERKNREFIYQPIYLDDYLNRFSKEKDMLGTLILDGLVERGYLIRLGNISESGSYVLSY